jgi:hypothetical protein
VSRTPVVVVAPTRAVVVRSVTAAGNVFPCMQPKAEILVL